MIEINGRDDGETGAKQISLVEGADFGNVTASQHADANAHIPRSEVGGCGRTPLAVGGKADKQRVIGRKHGAKTDAQQQGDAKEQKGTGMRIPPHDIHTAP